MNIKTEGEACLNPLNIGQEATGGLPLQQAQAFCISPTSTKCSISTSQILKSQTRSYRMQINMQNKAVSLSIFTL